MKKFSKPIQVTRPLFPRLKDYVGNLEDVWESQWLSNGGKQHQLLEKELQVMDLAAFTLARDHSMTLRVFNMNKPGALKSVIMGGQEGTTIDHAENLN